MACNFSSLTMSTGYPTSVNPVEAYQPVSAPSEDYLHEYLRKLFYRDPSHCYSFKYSFVNNLMDPRGRKKSMLNYLLECIFTKCQGEGNDGQEQMRLSYYKLVSVEFNMIFNRLSVYACLLHFEYLSFCAVHLLYIYCLPFSMVMQTTVLGFGHMCIFHFSPKMLCSDSSGAQ